MPLKYCRVIVLFLALFLLLTACGVPQTAKPSQQTSFTLETLPPFDGENPYVAINNNEPFFTAEDFTTKSYEYYAPLDALGRCGVTVACVGVDIMPTEDRESIGQVKPTGWKTVKYDFVDGKYLYNRCHLLGFQLTGENANKQNLITGTRFFNTMGMLPFENMVADYVKETGNHVLYRVTPQYNGNELVARGVLMEAKSVEDNGEEITFCVYVYNNQPGVEIDYATGESQAAEQQTPTGEVRLYVLNTNSKKFHLPTCSGVDSMNKENKQEVTTNREKLLLQGYNPCGTCDP